MDSIDNSNKPKTIKRRNFLFLLGASAVGAALLAGSPLKFITSKFGKQTAEAGMKKGKESIVAKPSPYAVKRERRNA
jgi:hypothetical protein